MCTDQSLANHLKELELRLMDPEVRQSAEEVSRLLADDFREFGSSGEVYDRDAIIRALQDEPRRYWALEDFKVVELSPDVVLATYKVARTVISTGDASRSLRCSIWVRRDGRWRMVFHQGTRTD